MNSAFRMANIAYFGLAGKITDIVDFSSNIERPHLLKSEVPECLVLIRVEMSVVAAEEVTTVVPHPHIIPIISKHKGQSSVRRISDIVVS